jgi:hypothetical protein
MDTHLFFPFDKIKASFTKRERRLCLFAYYGGIILHQSRFVKPFLQLFKKIKNLKTFIPLSHGHSGLCVYRLIDKASRFKRKSVSA